MPVTSLIMVPFWILKKFWKALGLLFQMTVNTTWCLAWKQWAQKLDWKQWGKRWKPPWKCRGSCLVHLWRNCENMGQNDRNDGGNHLKMTNLWMPVTSLIMVRFSIHKKFWKALDLLYQMTVEMTGNNGGNDGNDGGNDRNDRNDGGNHLKMTNLWMPVTSLIMVRFSIRKKFWKALDLLYQMTVEYDREMMETMGRNDGNNGGNDRNDEGN